MKQVFVETNFLIDLLRPFPGRDATTLFRRANVDVTLHIPWVSITEAKRTLDRVIRDDLNFDAQVNKLAAKLLETGTLSKTDMPPVQAFVDHIKNARAAALTNASADLDAAVAYMQVIPPSPGVVAKTMSIYPIKFLPPFDEMVLGAVLYQAEQLHRRGVPELYFCNANVKDFGPTSGNPLAQHYAACDLQYVPNFSVP